jgi:CRP-like cAMP-binding protein
MSRTNPRPLVSAVTVKFFGISNLIWFGWRRHRRYAQAWERRLRWGQQRKARIARALRELAEHLGRESDSGKIVILHKIRQSDIAAMAGVARENVSRTLTELKRLGLISQSSSYYFINDRRKLLRETEDLA